MGLVAPKRERKWSRFQMEREQQPGMQLVMTTMRQQRKRALPLVCIAAVVTAITAASAPSASSSMQCPAPTSRSDSIKLSLKKTLASGFSDDSAFSVNIGLGGVDSSQVVAVTDSVVCTRVTAIVDSATRNTFGSLASLFVLRAGPRLIGFAHTQADPSLFFLDTAYHFIGVVPE